MTHPASIFPISAIAVSAILLLSGCGHSAGSGQLNSSDSTFTDIYGRPLPNVLPKAVVGE